MDIAAALADERRAIADRLETLTPEQWRVQTLCPAWDVHGLVAHLVVPCDFSTVELVTTMVRARGNPDRLSVLMAARRAERSSAELVALLREKADSRLAPPIIGIVGPYTDALVHQQDILIPLGLTDERPPARWRPSLDFLVSAKARIGFLPGRIPALRYVATDLDWSHDAGSGPQARDAVHAPAAALALALLRREPRLDELAGPGAETLREWARA
ncbi:maleylpyruvate isomerase family mycothiol-dependent enzyme [Nocardioides psychrotolerans]|uniref:maleylpyruvate isomerase family mycothiol-dependent enzyme n=1 Tax=Nocardioides psychrotolerans TaxID=1005945 RepID=UPI0031383357